MVQNRLQSLRRAVVRLAELNRTRSVNEADWPLRSYQAHLSIALDFGPHDVPPAAQRRIALRLLRRLLEETEERDLVLGEGSLRVPLTQPALAESLPPEAPLPPEPAEATAPEWDRPGLDLRIVKSAHKVVQEVERRGVGGRAVLASELTGAGLSAPTLGRLLREGSTANTYLRRYVRIIPHGRTKALDLTPAGRVLASRIRAGAAPV